MPLAAALFLLMQSRAPPALSLENPQWVRRPNMEAMRRHYPQAALEEGVEGRAVIACAVAADGALTGCEVAAEEPAGYGLGEAALKVAPEFRMQPTTLQGRPVAGGRVRIPIGFGINPRDAFISIKGEGGWKVLQQPWEWERFYPLKARQQKVSGEAKVECRPNERRKIICTVLGETPGGHGFGKAALDLQGKLLMAPPPGATEKVLQMTVKFRPPRD